MLPGWLSDKESACQAGDVGLIPGSEDSLEKEMATRSSILAWEIHGQRSLVGYSLWDCKRVGHDLATKQQQQSGESFYESNIAFRSSFIIWRIMMIILSFNF